MATSDVTVTCPKCKQSFTVPGGQFDAERSIACYACGHEIGDDGESLQPALDRIGAKLRGMQDLL